MDSPGPSKQDHYRTTGQARKGEKDKKERNPDENGETSFSYYLVFFFLGFFVFHLCFSFFVKLIGVTQGGTLANMFQYT